MSVLMVLVAGLFGAAVVVPASPALALCTGPSCAGLDPEATGCSADAFSLGYAQEANDNRFFVELRKSGRCNAMWARFSSAVSNYAPQTYWRAKVQRQLYSAAANNWIDVDVRHVRPNAGQAGTWWTPMVASSDNDRIRACFGLGPGEPQTCTNWNILN